MWGGRGRRLAFLDSGVVSLSTLRIPLPLHNDLRFGTACMQERVLPTSVCQVWRTQTGTAVVTTPSQALLGLRKNPGILFNPLGSQSCVHY